MNEVKRYNPINGMVDVTLHERVDELGDYVQYSYCEALERELEEAISKERKTYMLGGVQIKEYGDRARKAEQANERYKGLLQDCEPYVEAETKNPVIWNAESIYLMKTKALLRLIRKALGLCEHGRWITQEFDRSYI